MSEKWTSIPGYIGLYQVSDLGKVRALEKLDMIGRKRKEKLLKPSIGHKGYAKVTLYKNNIRKVIFVHRLVTWVFVRELPKGMKKLQINHVDGDKTNNSLANLEIVTPKENARHAKENGLTTAYEKGRNNKYARKVTCLLDGKVVHEFGAIVEAAQMLLICQQNISDALRGNRKKAGGFEWKYKK